MCERSQDTRDKIAEGMRRHWRDGDVRLRRREAARVRRLARRRERAATR